MRDIYFESFFFFSFVNELRVVQPNRVDKNLDMFD